MGETDFVVRIEIWVCSCLEFRDLRKRKLIVFGEGIGSGCGVAVVCYSNWKLYRLLKN